MRIEYLILPPEPEPIATRILRAIRKLFAHPGSALLLGLLLLFVATQINALSAPPVEVATIHSPTR